MPCETPLPSEAIISVTNRCDARCTMCNIWRLKPQEGLGPEDYRRLPASLRNVNVTGGEPLLRKDIVEVVQAIHEAGDGPRIILATNGFRTERTLRTLEEIRRHVPRLGVAVSLDGDALTHDRMRGVPRAYARALETVRGLRDLGIEDVRLGFTATSDNVSQLPAIHGLAEDLGVELAATVAQNSEIYYSTDANGTLPTHAVEVAFEELMERRLRSAAPKDWVRAYFEAGVVRFVKTGRRRDRCHAASDFFYLAPTGEVFPCLSMAQAIGSLRDQSFETLWASPRARAVRARVTACGACWMVCTARTEIRRQPLKVLLWVVREKTRAHLGGGPWARS